MWAKYAFSVIHAHGAIWKERGLLTSQGSKIKHASQILKLWEAIHLPVQVAVMHCKAHQKGDNDAAVRGNQLADKAAKEVATAKILALIPEKVPRILDQTPHYEEHDRKFISNLGAKEQKDGWAVTPQRQIILTPSLMREVAAKDHEATHWGTETLIKHLRKTLLSRYMAETVKSVVEKCEICKTNNPNTGKRVILGITKPGITPGEYWQTDFTELPRTGGYKYLLVLVDTFSGWPEAYLCRTNMTCEVVKQMLNQILPRFGVPAGMSSDRGPHFIAEVVKMVGQYLGVK